jgi:hypothetical protein
MHYPEESEWAPTPYAALRTPEFLTHPNYLTLKLNVGYKVQEQLSVLLFKRICLTKIKTFMCTGWCILKSALL